VAPLALSAVTEYTLGTVEALRAIYAQAVGQRIPATTNIPAFPELPTDILPSFRDMVETSDEAIAGAFADILSDVQIHRARIQSLISGIPRRSIVAANVEQYLIDAACIHAQASALFAYARRQTDDAPGAVSWDAVRSSLHQLGLWDEHYENLFQVVSRRQTRGVEP
jgi:hypothetical protein